MFRENNNKSAFPSVFDLFTVVIIHLRFSKQFRKVRLCSGRFRYVPEWSVMAMHRGVEKMQRSQHLKDTFATARNKWSVSD